MFFTGKWAFQIARLVCFLVHRAANLPRTGAFANSLVEKAG